MNLLLICLIPSAAAVLVLAVAKAAQKLRREW